MASLRHLTIEELLFRAEGPAVHSPLIAELVNRLRHAPEPEPAYQPKDDIEEADCPVCDAKLHIHTFANESAPTLTTAKK